MNKKYVYISSFVIVLLLSFNEARLPLNKIETDKFRDYQQELPDTDLKIDMLAIPGGNFDFSVDQSNNEVKISPFWMAKYETTWQLYELFIEGTINKAELSNKPNEVAISVDAVSGATTPYTDMSRGMGRDDGLPVTNVTQYAAAQFCKWLSAKTGHFYRLPTEAEWEYACKAGSETTYYFGNDVSKLQEHAWFKGNSDERYHEVGQKKENPFGLYDMYGNVAEWTLDAFEEQTPYSKKDPYNVATELYPRVLRGGSWKDDKEALQSSFRLASNNRWKMIDPQVPKSLHWHTNAPFIGFRVVRPLNPPSKEEMETYWMKPIEEY